jgi:hypothetical protein
MLFPVLSVPINLPKLLGLDTHESLDPLSSSNTPDFMMAGKAYVSLAATTTDTNFGVLQVTRWTFEEVAMCPILQATCTISGMNKGQAFRHLLIKNIGKEKIYVKFKYQSPKFN